MEVQTVPAGGQTLCFLHISTPLGAALKITVPITPPSGFFSKALAVLVCANFRTPFVTVALNLPTAFSLGFEANADAAGPGGSADVDFSNSFKPPTGSDVFNTPAGVTVNAGDYLVNNRFHDPLATSGGVPEPSAWALMIAGFGLAGTTLRRRRPAFAT